MREPGEESIYFGRKRGENLSKYSYSLLFCERISVEGESGKEEEKDKKEEKEEYEDHKTKEEEHAGNT